MGKGQPQIPLLTEQVLRSLPAGPTDAGVSLPPGVYEAAPDGTLQPWVSTPGQSGVFQAPAASGPAVGQQLPLTESAIPSQRLQGIADHLRGDRVGGRAVLGNILDFAAPPGSPTFGALAPVLDYQRQTAAAQIDKVAAQQKSAEQQKPLPEIKPAPRSNDFDDIVANTKAMLAGANQPQVKSSTSSQSAEYGPDEVLRATMAAGQKEVDAETISAEQQEAITKEQTVSQRWADEIAKGRKKYGSRADVLYKRFEAVTAELDAARARLDAMEIDPNRLMANMPTLQAVLGGLGVAFSTGAGQGKQAWAVVQGAIDRDFAGQRAEVQQRLQQTQLTVQQQQALFRQWTATEGMKVDAARDIAKLEIGAAGLEGKKVEARKAASDAIYAAQRDMVTAGAKGRRRSTTVTTRSSGGGAGKMLQTRQGERNNFKSEMESLREMVNLKKSYLHHRPGAGKLIGTPAARKFESDRQRALALYTRAMTGAEAPEGVIKRYEKIFAQAWEPADTLFGKGHRDDVNIYRADKLIESMRRQAKDRIRGSRGLLQMLGPGDAALLRGRSTPSTPQGGKKQ